MHDDRPDPADPGHLATPSAHPATAARPDPDAAPDPGSHVVRPRAVLVAIVPGLLAPLVGLAIAIAVRVGEGAVVDVPTLYASMTALLSGQEFAGRSLIGGPIDLAMGEPARVLPFGLVLVGGVLLARVRAVRAAIAAGRVVRWVPPLVAVAVAGLVAVGTRLVAEFGLGSELGLLGPTHVGLRPLSWLLVGAGPWLLAMALVRWRTTSVIAHGLLVLHLVTVGGLAIHAFLDGFGSWWWAAIRAIGALFFGANLVAGAATLPFLGALGVTGPRSLERHLAGYDDYPVGFLAVADEFPLAWVAPMVVALGLLALGGLRRPASGWVEVHRRAIAAVGGLTLLLLPVLWFGGIRVRTARPFAAETGPAAADVAVTYGTVGQPWRFAVFLATAWLLLVGSSWLRARSSASWSSDERALDEVRRVAATTTSRARRLAETARAAGAAAAVLPAAPPPAAPTAEPPPPSRADPTVPPPGATGPDPADRGRRPLPPPAG